VLSSARSVVLLHHHADPGVAGPAGDAEQLTLPSPHHPPLANPGQPFPPEVTDNRVLWELDARSINASPAHHRCTWARSPRHWRHGLGSACNLLDLRDDRVLPFGRNDREDAVVDGA
jgi:hypothetical protein